MSKFLVPSYVYKAKEVQETIYKSEVNDEDVALLETLSFERPDFYPKAVRASVPRLEYFKRASYIYLGELAARLGTTESERIVSAGDQHFDWKYLPDRISDFEKPVFICAGAGINISFEIHLAETYPNATIIVLDPSPQSVAHFKNMDLPDNLTFLPIGLAGRDEMLKFFRPNLPGAGSLSALQLNPGDAYFELPVSRTTTVLKKISRAERDLALLKFDIEGSEHEVIDDLIATDLLPPQLAFEFDQPVPPWKLEHTLRKLLIRGYEVRAIWQLNVLLERVRKTEPVIGSSASKPPRPPCICPICDSEITDPSVRKICHSCGNGDRTRAVRLMYDKIKPITRGQNALVFTAENWLPNDMFATCERSVYLGANHLDIQDIDREDESYTWIASNHVLEHVAQDDAALKEMFRILSKDGILQLTVPTPSRVFRTNDWGYADETKMGHFRNYGAEFTETLRKALPEAYILNVFLTDTLSPYKDITYLLAKTENRMQIAADLLLQNRYLVVPMFPEEEMG